MKTKIKKTGSPRDFREDIDGILHGYGPRARVVQLWRLQDGTRDKWTYLGRFVPEHCEIDLIGERFGGGWYSAKIFGDWDPERREECFEQVAFGLDDRAWPVTEETLARFRKQQQK